MPDNYQYRKAASILFGVLAMDATREQISTAKKVVQMQHRGKSIKDIRTALNIPPLPPRTEQQRVNDRLSVTRHNSNNRSAIGDLSAKYMKYPRKNCYGS